MVNRKRKATTTIDTNVSTIVDNNDNSEAINNESIGRIKSKNSKSKSSTTTIVDNGDDHDDHHQPSKSKSSKRSTRRTTPASNQSTSNNSNNNVDDDHDQIESQVDKSKIKRTRGNRKQVESTIASNSDDIASTSTNLVDNVKTTKKSAKPTKNVTFDIDTVNIEEDKTKQTLRRSSRTTTRASTAASSAVAKISTSSSSSSSSSTTASRKKTTATKSDTPIKQSAPSSSRSRAKKQDKPESIEPIENSQEDQHVEKESMVKSKRSSKSSKQSETKFKKTTTTTQNEQHEETKNEPEPTVISKKRSTRGVKSKPEVVENVVDNEPKEVKERPRSTRKTAAATSVTESSSKSTNKRSTQKQRNKTELVDEIQTTELENVEEETKTESSKRKSARNLTKSMNQAAVETEPEQTTSEPKKSVAATAKSKRPRRGAASTVVEEVIKESEPEIPSLVQDEPDFIQQIPVTKPETENEKNIPNHSESEEQISANNNVEEKKIAEVVDKVNEIVDVIESETNISQSLSSLTAAATTVAKEDTEKIDEKVNNETCSKESKMPKNQVSFEIVDMDDNEEIEPDTHVIAIDHEQMIIDDGSRSSMPSSIESKDKQSDLDLDSTIIVIEDSQSSDGSLLQPSIVSKSIVKQETNAQSPIENEPKTDMKEFQPITVSNDQTKIEVDIKQSISVVNEAESLATNSNGQSMVIEDDNDERGSKRKVPDSFTISSEDTMQSPVAKKARFELPDHGDLFTMGDQISKELGPREIYFHGRKTLRSQPAKVRIGSYKIKQVAMGALHTLALTVNGQILSFGCNDDYVLGRFITREEYTNNLITNGGDDDLDELDVDDDEFEEKLSGRPLPVKELRSKTVVKVSAGDMHSAALCDDGKVYVWGNFKDDSDKVGLFVDCEKSPNCSDYLPIILPKQVEIDMKIIDIASGSHHILMLTEEGNVFTFGDGSKGQLGRIVSTELNSIKTNRDLFLRPQMVSIPEQAKIEHVFASQWNSFALSTDGNLYGWGLNNYFQLGLKNDFISQANSLNSDSLFTLIPTRIPLSFKCKQVSNGQQHSLALDNDGNVYACGSALYGKLGLGEDFIRQCNNDKSISDFKQIPSTIFNKERVIKVDCGDFCSMAITETGKLYCWGQGGLQIGTSADEDLFEPRQIKNGPYDECTRFISISTGAQMAAMIGTIINDDDNDNDLQMD